MIVQEANDIRTVILRANIYADSIRTQFRRDLQEYVTDCFLSWLKDKTEWTNTKMSFEISTENNLTIIHFTHIGLEPQVEYCLL